MLLLLFNGGTGAITGTLAVTEAMDVAAFSGDFAAAGWVVIANPSSEWAAATDASSNWVAKANPSTTWTPS